MSKSMRLPAGGSHFAECLPSARASPSVEISEPIVGLESDSSWGGAIRMLVAEISR